MEAFPSSPLRVVQLAGSQAQMGDQFGRLLRPLPQWHRLMEFYPQMAARVLSLSLPDHLRRRGFRALHMGLWAAAGRLVRYRKKHFPEFHARTQAQLRAAGVDPSLERAFMAMDALQNTVGSLGRVGVLPAASAGALAACSSVAVWGDKSATGNMLLARNFDFPGAGLWEEAPSVVFCKPDEGVPYGFVTTVGADVPGVSAFNAEGLALVAHTRFHRDITLQGAPVVDIGHRLISQARNMDELMALARKLRSASSWGFLVVSAKEKRAAVMELTSKGVRFVPPKPGAEILGQSNRYLSDFAEGEVASSPGFVADSTSRYARASCWASEQPGPLSIDDLKGVLANVRSPQGKTPEGAPRSILGDGVVSPITVKSIVVEPGEGRLHVASGQAPTSLGPWRSMPMEWTGTPSSALVEGEASGPTEKPQLTTSERRAIELYVAACKARVAGANRHVVYKMLREAEAQAPGEPHLLQLLGFYELQLGQTASAELRFRVAAAHSPTAYRKGLSLFWQGRALQQLGRRSAATEVWKRLAAMDEPTLASLQARAAQEDARPLRPAAYRNLVVDVLLVEAQIFGESPVAPALPPIVKPGVGLALGAAGRPNTLGLTVHAFRVGKREISLFRVFLRDFVATCVKRGSPRGDAPPACAHRGEASFADRAPARHAVSLRER